MSCSRGMSALACSLGARVPADGLALRCSLSTPRCRRAIRQATPTAAGECRIHSSKLRRMRVLDASASTHFRRARHSPSQNPKKGAKGSVCVFAPLSRRAVKSVSLGSFPCVLPICVSGEESPCRLFQCRARLEQARLGRAVDDLPLRMNGVLPHWSLGLPDDTMNPR